MKAKTTSNPLKYFNDAYEARVKTFSRGGDFNKETEGYTTENVTRNYNNYKAPKATIIVSPSAKKGGMVKFKKK